MNVTIQPATLRGTITPPPSKSQAHRLIIAAALAGGESVISNVAFSQDILATLSCMEQLGARWEKTEEHVIRISGISAGQPLLGEDGLPHFDCGESGSTLRFLIPIALAVAGGGMFTGRGRLMERPQQPYFDLFDEKGIAYTLKDGVLTVRGCLEAGEYALPGDVSSQFFTGLLYALSLADGDSLISSTTQLESVGYINMTRQAMAAFGVESRWQRARTLQIAGGQSYAPSVAAVEADWSQAGFWYAAAGIGNDLKVTGMNENSIQGDRVILDWGQMLRDEPLGGVVVPILGRPKDGTAASQDAVKAEKRFGVSISVRFSPDLVPPLAAWGALTPGCDLLIKHAERLRIKESDRLASVTAVLNALGAQVTEKQDSLFIRGMETLAGGVTVDSFNDHRIAMMAAIAATRCAAPVTITGAECVRKSYPDFWEDYEMLGGQITREG